MVKLELFDIVGEQITVESVRSFLNANKTQEIQFDIASLGGDLATAITIHDLIKIHPKRTVANIVGLTASAGTVIAIACDEVQISDNALFLIHNGWKEVTGNVFDMQKAATDLMKTDAIMVKIYRERTGLPDSQIKDLMKASDWLIPDEALNYGFVDRIEKSVSKIAASVLISGAQGKINEQLLIKLNEKMKNPFVKTKAQADVMNVLALKAGGSVLINAEEAATGVEVAPLGAMSLEDGEYELADGRKIVVAGGVITEVKEVGAAIEATTTEEVVAAVSALFNSQVEALTKEVKETLAKISSTHVPVKGTGITATTAKVDKPDVASKIEETTKAIFDKIAESRKA
jgi:ATP-dependent protease ClpP protease subunit